jgi:hypothetical protein
MNRRGFLSLLGLGGAGLLIDRAIPGGLLPELPAAEIQAPIVLAAGNALFTPTRVAYEVARAFHESLEAAGWETQYRPYETGTRLGERAGGVLMTDRLHVSLPPWQYGPEAVPTDESELMDAMRERYFRPAGSALADGVRRKGIRYLSDLPMPNGGAEGARVTSTNMGLSLRGVRQYDITADQMFERFDIIGGH